MPKYNSFDELYGDCTLWFSKPRFQKPAVCPFEDMFLWYGFNCAAWLGSISFKHFLKIEELSPINEKIKEIVRESLNDDITDKIGQWHHKWVGEIDISMTIYNEHKDSDDKDNVITIYLTKPSSTCIQVAGIDRCKIWLSKPSLKRINYDSGMSKFHAYYLDTGESNFFIGKMFRKTQNLKPISELMWSDIVNNYNVPENEFYDKINDKNHKKGQSEKKFIKEYKVVIKTI